MNEEKELARYTLGMGPRPTPPTGPDAIIPPVDLRAIPREQWSRHKGLPVLIPDAVQKYIDGMDGAASREETASMEDAVCAFHGILPFPEPSERWTVSMSSVEFCLLEKVL